MSFSTAFQTNAFQQNAFQIAVEETRPPGGWLPIKYVRDGRVIEPLDEPEQTPLAEPEEPITVSPDILAAFFMPPDILPELRAGLDEARAELRLIERRMMQEEEEAAMALLLLA